VDTHRIAPPELERKTRYGLVDGDLQWHVAIIGRKQDKKLVRRTLRSFFSFAVSFGFPFFFVFVTTDPPFVMPEAVVVTALATVVSAYAASIVISTADGSKKLV